jgi:hypothetical protein
MQKAYIADALCFVKTSKLVEEVPPMKPFASWMVIDTAPMKDSMPGPAQLCITIFNIGADTKTTDVIFPTFKAEK